MYLFSTAMGSDYTNVNKLVLISKITFPLSVLVTAAKMDVIAYIL